MATAEPVRAPASLVDHHVHLLGPGLVADWKRAGARFSKPDDAYGSVRALLGDPAETSSGQAGPLRRAALVPMAHLYGRPGFSEALGLSLEDEHARVRAENDHVAREAARYPGRAIAFCSVGVLRPYAWQEILRCHEQLHSAGVKLHLGSAGTDLRDEHLAQVEKIAAWSESEGKALLVHFDPQHRGLTEKDVERFVRRVLAPHPRLEVWIAHLGGSGGYGPWTRSVLRVFADWLLAQPAGTRPGVYFDLSAAVLEEESEGVPATTAEELGALSKDLRRVGLDRLVFGSDHPVFAPQDYARLLGSRLELTPAEQQRLFGNEAPALRRIRRD